MNKSFRSFRSLWKALSLVEPVHSTYNDRLLGYVQVVQTLEGYHEMSDDLGQSIIILV